MRINFETPARKKYQIFFIALKKYYYDLMTENPLYYIFKKLP